MGETQSLLTSIEAMAIYETLGSSPVDSDASYMGGASNEKNLILFILFLTYYLNIHKSILKLINSIWILKNAWHAITETLKALTNTVIVNK